MAPVRRLPDGSAWTYEAKLDGYRCLVARRNNDVVLYSRRGNSFTQQFPDIAGACETLPPNTLIDGEVIVIDGAGKVSFNALQHTCPAGRRQFYAFDILIHRGRNVTRLPLKQRCELLRDALWKIQYPVIQSIPFDVRPVDLLRAAKELELEGVIAKRKGFIYEPVGAAARGLNALIVGCYEGGKLK